MRVEEVRNSWCPAKVLDCLSDVGTHQPKNVFVCNLSGIDEVNEDSKLDGTYIERELLSDLSRDSTLPRPRNCGCRNAKSAPASSRSE